MVKEIRFKDLNAITQILIALGFFFAIATFIVTSSSMVTKPEDLEDFARWECHNETIEKWITLQGRVCVGNESYWGGISCTYENAKIEFNDETDEVDCEEGVMRNIFNCYPDEIINLTPEPKNCLIKTTKEVCEIV